MATKDGTISGTKKWGDGKGSEYTDGTIYYECMGCRKELDKPELSTANDEYTAEDWALIDEMVAKMRGESSSTAA